MKRIVILWLLLLSIHSYADDFFLKRWFPKTALTVQYAGSIGFMSAGYSRVTPNEKIELGLLYGKVPERFGGAHHTLNLKFTYNPFRLYVTKRILIEPIQTGVFLSQNFGEGNSVFWGNKYPKGYYWWGKYLRFHGFISTQVSFKACQKSFVDRVSLYLEANTNDLYFVYSYLPNTRTMNIYDVFFLGTGVKLYLK